MPELPEVETIRRGLSKVIVGRKIVKFESRDAKVVQFAKKDVEGFFITNIERRAKILVFHLNKSAVIPDQIPYQKYGTNPEATILDPRTPSGIPDLRGDDKKEGEDDNGIGSDDKVLLCHLKMTGQLIWEEKPGTNDFQLKKSRVAGGHPSPDWVAKLPNAYTRAILTFDDKSVLFFNDLRRFGYMKLYDVKCVIPDSVGDPLIVDSRLHGNDKKKSGNDKEKGKDDSNISPPLTPPCKGGEYAGIPELAKLGPEPFSSDFNVEYLMRRAAKIPNRKIKQFITDQEIISGVGNIYVDEALFYTGILPTRAVKDIHLSEWKKIKESIIKALELGLKYGGSSEDTYVDAFGNQGTMNEHTMVYRKTGQPCQVCGTIVKRITLGGRGTHFCSKCQV